jgi:short-subunit dehydrogenase
MGSPFLHSNVWLIGASTGIGKAIVRRIAPEVKQLFISSRSRELLEEVKKDNKTDSISVVPCDVGDLDSLKTAYKTVTYTEPLDILLFNAGIYNESNVLSFDLSDYIAHMDINYHGALRAVSLVLPDMIERKSGHIMAVSSVAGYRALPNAAAYGASKAALSYFLESMRMHVASKGVKVTIINPGFVKTRLTDKNSFEMPFLLTTEEAADAIYNGLVKGKDEIHFPKKFSLILKFLGLLPEPWYRALIMKFILKNNS